MFMFCFNYEKLTVYETIGIISTLAIISAFKAIKTIIHFVLFEYITTYDHLKL